MIPAAQSDRHHRAPAVRQGKVQTLASDSAAVRSDIVRLIAAAASQAEPAYGNRNRAALIRRLGGKPVRTTVSDGDLDKENDEEQVVAVLRAASGG